MTAWESIQVTLNYIEENPGEDISIKNLAKLANLSVFYYQRLFKRLVNKTVMEYIKLRRLAKASQYMSESHDRIIDVALRFGFENHETFTRAFKSAYGLTPEEYKRSPIRLNQFQKPELLLNYVMIDENVPLVSDGIVLEIKSKKLEQPEIYFGRSRQVSLDQLPIGEATGVDIPGQLWEDFHKKKSSILGLDSNGVELGASYFLADNEEEEGFFNYFVGGKASVEAQKNEKDAIWELPVGEYIVCCLEAKTFEQLVTVTLDIANRYLFDTWLKRHKLTTMPFSAEKYYKNVSDNAYMEIWVMPIPSVDINSNF